MTDPVADSLTRIKNAYMSRRGSVDLVYSKLVLNIANLLSTEGYVGKIKEGVDEKNKNIKLITVELIYDKKQPVMTDVKRVSRPSLRVYSNAKRLPKVLNGLGVAIISTPKGVMTDKQARKAGLGGEVMALIW